MKKSDLFRVGVRLMARDRSRLPTRIITIILSAFSFMLFALASTAFFYSDIDLYTRAFFYYTTEGYLQEEPVHNSRYHYPYTYFSFYNENEEEAAAVRQQVLEETGKNYIYTVSTSYRTEDFLGRTDEYWEDSQDEQWWQPDRVRSVAGSEAALGELGFSLLAGNYPRERNQIALRVGAYELFQKYGYRDVTEIYTQTPPADDGSSNDTDIDWLDVWQGRYIYDLNEERSDNMELPFFYFQEAAASEVPEEPITDMQDLIGKYLVGFRMLSDGQIVMEPLEIVGIVDSTREKVGYWLAEASVFSEEWIADCTTYYRMYATPPANYGEAKRAVSLAYDYHMAGLAGETQTRLSLTNMDYLFPEADEQLNNERLIALIGCVAGAFFGIFALLLNGHLTTRSIEARQRQVGILRSLGAGRGDIRLIILVDILFTATCVFLVALAGSLGMFYGLLYEWLLIPRFNVRLMQYTGWTVLILAALCYAVPLLCAVLPVHKFFKKSIVDCISGTAVPPKRRKSPHRAT